MLKLTKMAFSTILWLGRGAATTMGLALMFALTVGLASSALAAVPGDPFKLGRTNTIEKMSTLVGSASGALLSVNNEGSGPALDLRVEPGEAPMNVNSTTQVDDFNADKLDGKDSTAFMATETYTVQELQSGGGGGQIGNRIANCDQGDILLGGGFDASVDDNVISSSPNFDVSGWSVGVKDNGPSTVTIAKALCADLPPRR
jgi:hypothetical protein